jgi:hypothetical protein
LLAILVLACGAPTKSETTTPAPEAATASTATSAAGPTASEAPVASSAPPVVDDPPPPGPPAGEDDPQAALATAKKAGKPALFVFCARWVAACGELAHALAEAGVRKALDEKFVVARVDVSDEEAPATKERMKKYDVKGLPFMIVFDRKGKELARESGYLDAGRISKLLERAK